MKKLKDTFFYNLMTSGIGLLFILMTLTLLVFRDGCSKKKVVQMQEDIIYIKPNN